MKLSDFLQNIGRPVAYYPGLRKITGSTTATILLCQLFYWTGKEISQDGWIYKTSEELTEETGLSYDEQATARKSLLTRDLIEERYDRLNHKMYFRVKKDNLNAVWEIPETGNAKMGKPDLPCSLNSNTENTPPEIKSAETTPTKTPLPVEWQIGTGAEKIVLPTDEQEWNAKVDIAVMNICRSGMDLQELANTFIRQRKILPAKKTDAKGWAGAFREMKQAGAKPEHITQAIQKLCKDQMTIADPWSIKKTVIALAVPVQPATPIHPKARTL